VNPILKWGLNAPQAIYAAGGGRLLGHRFLLLIHRGRHSGRSHRTVLEVLQWRPAEREAIVMSGFGPRANWLRNVAAAGDAAEIEIAGARVCAHMRVVGRDEAIAVLAGYERRNRLIAPILRRVLSRLAGFRYDGSPAARARVVETLPLVGFRARD
jgi:deazaflavin-dependent oxidoreductase (nitroreductase family)